MIVALSYILAVIFTVLVAVILYPIAAVFWVLGLFGKLAEYIFALTKKAIAYLWKDISKFKNSTITNSNADDYPVNSVVNTEQKNG